MQVIQRTTSEELADWVPTVDSGWACTLAILKEYLENHEPHARRVAEARRAVEPDPQHAAEALASTDAIREWDGELPERVLAATPHGGVVVFPGFSGVFTLMAAGQVVVWCATWGDEDMEPAEAMDEEQGLALVHPERRGPARRWRRELLLGARTPARRGLRTHGCVPGSGRQRHARE